MKDDRTTHVPLAVLLALVLAAPQVQGAQVAIGESITSGTTLVLGPGATPAASGSALLAALGAISDASESKRYLVRLQPGLYDLGKVPLNLPSYVSLQGSGVMETKITGKVAASDGGVVSIGAGQDAAHLSHLAVENTGGSGNSSAIFIQSASPLLNDVYALASGGENNIGVYNDSAAPTLLEMRCVASGPGNANIGIVNAGGSPLLQHVYAEASEADNNYGVVNEGGSPTLRYMTVVANGGETAVGVENMGGTPELVHVGISVSGAADNAGIRNFDSSDAVIADLSVTVQGGSKTKGVRSVGSTVRVKNVSITASGATGSNYGVFVDGAEAFLERVVVRTQGPGETVGVKCQKTSTVRVNHSSVYGATHTVRVDGEGCDLKVGLSHLNGGPAVGGTCAGVTDEDYVFSAAGCP